MVSLSVCFFVPKVVSAAQECQCLYYFTGLLCEINEQKTYPTPSLLTVANELGTLDRSNCDSTFPLEAFFNNPELFATPIPEKISITTDLCGIVNYQGYDPQGGGYTFLLSCSLIGTPDPPVQTTAQDDKDGELFSGTLQADIKGLNPLTTTDAPTLIGRVLGVAVGIMGSIALGIFIFGGLLWMFSMGNQDRIQKAQNLLVWAGLGVLVILASYAIVQFLFQVF